MLGAQPRAGVPGQARAARRDHARAPRSRSRRYFARYGGRTILIGRFIGLVRALAPFIAGSSKSAVQELRAVQHPRHRSVVDRPDPARLLLRAEPRQGHEDRRQGPARLRDRRRGRRGARRGLPVPARSPRTGGKVVAEMEKRRALRPHPARWGAGCARSSSSSWRRLTPGGLRARVHDAAGGALGRAVRPDRVLVGDRRGPGADARGPDRLERRRMTCRPAWLVDIAKVVTWLGSGLGGLPAGRPSRRSSWRTGGSGWSSGCSSSAWR